MIDPDAILAEWRSGGAPETRAAAEAFLSDASKGRRFVLGCNAYGRALAEAFEIEGFVDTLKPNPQPFEGHEVFSADRVPADALLVNSVLIAKPRTAFEAMRTIPAAGHLNAADLLRLDEKATPLPDFVAETREDLAVNADEWAWLESVLKDEESRRTLSEILHFRLTADPDALGRHAFRPHEQYFDFEPLKEGVVFVDGGAFDGETTEALRHHQPFYGRSHIFEPFAENMALAKKRLAGDGRVVFHQCGLGAAAETLRFTATLGDTSYRVDEEGEQSIAVRPLDTCVEEPVDFIKLDVEGHESAALQGAADHIARDAPRLAVAAYHRTRDFHELARGIAAQRSDYGFNLRHYTEGQMESVLYAVDKSSLRKSD